MTDRASVRYSCIVTAAPPPLRHYTTANLRSIGRAAMAGTFTLLHALATREHPHYPYPRPDQELGHRLSESLPFEVTAETNDGIVPTFSQIYGDVLGVVLADHLDICGQFERKLKITGRDTGATAEEFGKYLMQTMKDPELAAKWESLSK